MFQVSEKNVLNSLNKFWNDKMISSETMMVMIVLMLLSCSVTSVDPESGGTVQRLISQQSSLIQPGLSFINSSNLAGISRVTLEDINNATVSTSQISCTINVVNWSRWLLGYPVYYFKYGHFKNGEFPQLMQHMIDLLRLWSHNGWVSLGWSMFSKLREMLFQIRCNLQKCKGINLFSSNIGPLGILELSSLHFITCNNCCKLTKLENEE